MLGASGLHEIRSMDRRRADDDENRQRNQLDGSGGIDQARAAGNAPDIDERDSANGGQDDRGMHRPCHSGRHHAHGHISQGGGNAAASEDIAHPQKGAGNVAREWPKCGLHIAIDSAAGGDAAATFGKADGDRSNRDSAYEKRQWRVGADGRRQRRWQNENSGADHHADNAGRERPRPDLANESRIAMVFMHRSHVSMRARDASVLTWLLRSRRLRLAATGPLGQHRPVATVK
jgi:hypothetical protein